MKSAQNVVVGRNDEFTTFHHFFAVVFICTCTNAHLNTLFIKFFALLRRSKVNFCKIFHKLQKAKTIRFFTFFFFRLDIYGSPRWKSVHTFDSSELSKFEFEKHVEGKSLNFLVKGFFEPKL